MEYIELGIYDVPWILRMFLVASKNNLPIL
jgi:hypothetical protein